MDPIECLIVEERKRDLHGKLASSAEQQWRHMMKQLAAAEAKLAKIKAACIGMAGTIHGDMVYEAIVKEIIDAERRYSRGSS